MTLLIQSSVFNFDNILAGATILVIVLFFLSLKKKPMYVFEDDGILFSFINRKILYSEIVEVRRIYREELGIGMRMGVGLPNASIGMFLFNSIGKVFMNSNDDNRMVLIKTKDIQIIISPENPYEFIARIMARR